MEESHPVPMRRLSADIEPIRILRVFFVNGPVPFEAIVQSRSDGKTPIASVHGATATVPVKGYRKSCHGLKRNDVLINPINIARIRVIRRLCRVADAICVRSTHWSFRKPSAKG